MLIWSNLKNKFASENLLWSRVKATTLLFFILTLGIELGRIGRDSYFLSTEGPDKIPYLYLFMAVLMLVASGIYSMIVDKIRRDIFMKYLLVSGIIFTFVVGLILRLKIKVPLFPFLVFCIVETYILFAFMHFWNYMNYVFDSKEGKPVFPLIGATGLLATICGGISAKLIVGFIGANALFFLWSGILLLCYPLVGKIRYIVLNAGHTGDTLVDLDSQMSEHKLGLDSMGKIAKIPLIRTIIYMSFPLWIIIYLVEYNYYGTMNRVYPNQDELAGFLGIFTSITSFVGLVLQLTLTPWILRLFGVGAASMVYPFSLTIGALSLLLFTMFPEALGANLHLFGIALFVVFARFCDITIYYSVYESTSQLIYYAIPEYLRGKSRALISGVVMPMAMAVAGGLLVYFEHLNEPIYNIAFVGLTCSFGLLVFSLKLTPDYLRSMLHSISPDDHKYREEVQKEILKLESSDVRYVLLGAITSNINAEALFAIEKLLENKDDELFEDIDEVATQLDVEVSRYILSKMDDTEKAKFSELVHTLNSKLNSHN